MADAGRVGIVIEFDGADSSVAVADDGRGMTANGLVDFTTAWPTGRSLGNGH